MIELKPAWSYTIYHPVYVTNLRLFSRQLLGVANESTWFSLDRKSGALLWENIDFGRPNTAVGVHDDILVATEYRCHDSPFRANYGTYGISLATQKLLWTSHGAGGWGRFLRYCDFVPGFANEFRDTPVAMGNGQVRTEHGRILDVVTGIDIPDAPSVEFTAPLERDIGFNLLDKRQVDMGALGILHSGTPEQPAAESNVINGGEPVRFFCRDVAGQVIWSFDATHHPEIATGDYWSLSLEFIAPYIYLVFSDSPVYTKPKVDPNVKPSTWATGGWDPAQSPVLTPSLYTLWVLDVRSGKIVQKMPLNEERGIHGRIADCDEEMLLVDFYSPDRGNYTLLAFPRRPKHAGTD